MDSPVPFGVPLPPGRRGQPQPALPEFFTPERLARRRAAMARDEAQVWKGVDATDSQGAAGHARGLRISVGLTSDYRQARRKDAMDIKPQEVILVLAAAGVKKWVLMGLHGYVGCLPWWPRLAGIHSGSRRIVFQCPR